MNWQRFRPVELVTDDRFYEDAETGLLMAVSCKLSDAEREAELERRSEKLIERLAIKIAALPGRPSTKGDDWKLAEEVEALERTGMAHRAAVGLLVKKVRERHPGISTDKSARERINAAIRKRRQSSH